MRSKRPTILLAALAAGAVLLSACGDDDSSDATTEGTEATGPSDDATTTTAGADNEAVTVAVATNDALGEHLVDGEGRTLYLFTRDTGTEATACTGGCLDNWPLLIDVDPTAGDGVDPAKLTVGGGDQVAYGGHLLYYFAGDAAPGDVNGADIPNWDPVDPDGNAITASGAGAEGTGSGDDGMGAMGTGY